MVDRRLGLVCGTVAIACLITAAVASEATRGVKLSVQLSALAVSVLVGLGAAAIMLRPFLEQAEQAPPTVEPAPARDTTAWRESLVRQLETGARLDPSAAEIDAWFATTTALLREHAPQLAGYFAAANSGERLPGERLAKGVARLHRIDDELL